MTARSSVISWLKDVTKEDADIVGKKATHLGELMQAGFPLAQGFIVMPAAYVHFLQENRLTTKIKQLLTTINYEHPDSLMQVSKHIQKLLMGAPFPQDFIKEVDSLYRTLSGSFGPVSVVISLSGNTPHEAEDFVGTLGENNLLLKIKEGWAAMFSPKALLHRYEKKENHFDTAHAIIVQKALLPEKSGILLTADPVTNDTTKIILETHGHTPLTDAQVQDLLTLGKKLQKYLYFPHEIVWGIEKGNIRIQHLKQITHTHTDTKEPSLPGKLQLLLNGIPAGSGMATGQVKIINHPDDLGTIHHGDILVALETNSSYRTAIKKAAGVVTEKGVRTSHAALLARELGKPAVVGVTNATKFLKNGMVVTIKGSLGEIYKTHGVSKTFHTATRLFGELSVKFASENILQKDIDGIGLIHPTVFLSDPQDELAALCVAFRPHPVIYSVGDVSEETFKTELQMIYHVRKEKKCQNLWVLLPSVSTIPTLAHLKHFMGSVGLERSASFKLLLTIAAPSTAIMLEDFIKTGIDGIVISIDELTAHMMPATNDPLDPSIFWILERMITTANKHKITSSIYGQSLIEHPALVEKVVGFGITSITVLPQALAQTREKIAAVEKRMIRHT